jgi:iron(III) transport system substrate-binding protein
VKRTIRSWLVLGVLALLCAAAATSAAYAASSSSSSSAKSVLARLATGAPRPATKKQWAKIVAQAKKEGSVTLYTSQNPLFLQDTVKAFKARYGITLTINRNVDGVLTQQVGAEESSGKVNADVVVIASLPTVLGFQKAPNLWATNEVGPDLYKRAYNRKLFGGPGKANIVGEAILGIGWNTSLYPKTIKDLPDLLDPSLKGKLGVVKPTSPSLVDWYLWVESRFGKAFLSKLAAQQPKVYTSSLPMTQAVASGEISVGSFVATSALDLKAQGAPINFVVPGGRLHGWNAPWWGMVLKKAPHPAAAQLLMDYLVTKEGQATSQQKLGVVLKGIPGTFYIKPRKQNLVALAPAKVTAFENYWASLFH